MKKIRPKKTAFGFTIRETIIVFHGDNTIRAKIDSITKSYITTQHGRFVFHTDTLTCVANKWQMRKLTPAEAGIPRSKK